MPLAGFRRQEGRAAPAAANHSPVARDYPSRARVDLFQAAALRLFGFSTDTPDLERLEDFLEKPANHFSTNGFVVTSGITATDFPMAHPRA
jgi:hypothetical protein